MPDFSNLILLRLAALELLRAVDPNLAHYCLLVSCASPCNNTSRAASTSAPRDAPRSADGCLAERPVLLRARAVHRDERMISWPNLAS